MKSLFKHRDVRSIVLAIVVTAAYQSISALTGFGAWLSATPEAEAIVRACAVLLFGGGGLALLIWAPRDAPAARPLFYRLAGALLLVIAFVNATILFGDPLHIRPE